MDAVGEQVDNRLAQIWAKEGTRILIAVAMLGGSYAWNGINHRMDKFESGQGVIRDSVLSLNLRLNEGIVRDLEANRRADARQDKQLSDLDTRTRALERSIPVR